MPKVAGYSNTISRYSGTHLSNVCARPFLDFLMRTPASIFLRYQSYIVEITFVDCVFQQEILNSAAPLLLPQTNWRLFGEEIQVRTLLVNSESLNLNHPLLSFSIEPDARMLPRETVLYGVGKIFHLEIFTETVSKITFFPSQISYRPIQQVSQEIPCPLHRSRHAVPLCRALEDQVILD